MEWRGGQIIGHRAKWAEGEGWQRAAVCVMCVYVRGGGESHCFSKVNRWREENERG